MSNVIGLIHKMNFKEDLGISTKSEFFSVVAHSEHGILGLMVQDLKGKRNFAAGTSYQAEYRQLRATVTAAFR